MQSLYYWTWPLSIYLDEMCNTVHKEVHANTKSTSATYSPSPGTCQIPQKQAVCNASWTHNVRKTWQKRAGGNGETMKPHCRIIQQMLVSFRLGISEPHPQRRRKKHLGAKRFCDRSERKNILPKKNSQVSKNRHFSNPFGRWEVENRKIHPPPEGEVGLISVGREKVFW